MRDVNIYWVKIPIDVQLDDVDKAACICLNNEELRTYKNYKVELKKIEYLIGRLLLKSIISKMLNTSIYEVMLVRSEFGKLFLDNQSYHLLNQRVTFNLTHTKRMVACAITTERNVGIDVEKLCQDHLNIMHRAFTQPEIDYINSKNFLGKLHAFYELWTRKEAYLKLIGKGFLIAPNTVSVPFDTPIAVHKNIEYLTLRLLDSYVLSVAVEKNNDQFNYNIYEVNFYDLLRYGITGIEYPFIDGKIEGLSPPT